MAGRMASIITLNYF